MPISTTVLPKVLKPGSLFKLGEIDPPWWMNGTIARRWITTCINLALVSCLHESWSNPRSIRVFVAFTPNGLQCEPPNELHFLRKDMLPSGILTFQTKSQAYIITRRPTNCELPWQTACAGLRWNSVLINRSPFISEVKGLAFIILIKFHAISESQSAPDLGKDQLGLYSRWPRLNLERRCSYTHAPYRTI